MNSQGQAGYDARIGKRVSDPEGRVGILTDVLRGTAYLRPERGGREWTVPVEDVEQVADDSQDADALSAKLAAVNKRSRGEAVTRSIITAAELALGPKTAEGAPTGIYSAECLTCGAQAQPTDDERLPVDVWALKHTGLNPTHRQFKATT